MKKITTAIPTVLIGLFLNGCATKVYMTEYVDDSRYGKITFIREYAEPTAFKLNIFADGQKAASIKNKSYATFSLPVGAHKLKVDWPATASSVEVEIPVTLKGMEHKYFYASQSVDVSNFRASGMGVAYDVSENLQVIEINPTDAQKVMRKLNL